MLSKNNLENISTKYSFFLIFKAVFTKLDFFNTLSIIQLGNSNYKINYLKMQEYVKKNLQNLKNI